jgi:hypothetical protein
VIGAALISWQALYTLGTLYGAIAIGMALCWRFRCKD